MSQIVHKSSLKIHKWMPRDPVSETSESGEFALIRGICTATGRFEVECTAHCLVGGRNSRMEPEFVQAKTQEKSASSGESSLAD